MTGYTRRQAPPPIRREITLLAICGKCQPRAGIRFKCCEFFWPLHPQMNAMASNFHVYLICSFEGGREERRGEANREQCWTAEWVAWSPWGVAGSQSEDFCTETKGVGAGGTHSYWQLGLGEGESSVLWPLSHYHPNLPDNPRGPFTSGTGCSRVPNCHFL